MPSNILTKQITSKEAVLVFDYFRNLASSYVRTPAKAYNVQIILIGIVDDTTEIGF